ncbi:MAG: sulfite exporter TauE/SafE family protein [Pseudomonadales bacterium]|nr:sulfite exporter TauE/SafE family protein [Pseudomonadales bacterium]MBO6564730.1 sulfite exporter TauE/SafE family protein [Pseudomonadales bacterium]MBO6597721.1 sulfite exporter TauE/SafE family protein [Pseudomonadales bacterium]
MGEINIIWFLAVVVAGVLVQTLTGFAMGLIIMVGVALFAIADIAFTAAVVSFISLVNALVAMRKGRHHIDWSLAGWMLAGSLPAMALGLYLLTYLSEHYYEMLRLLLGLVVILAGASLMISPQPFETRSGNGSFLGFGALGGILAGMYSVGGPPVAYFAYRQPMTINTVRFSLLAIIAGSTVVRALMVLVSGQMTAEIVTVSAVSIPVVVGVTLVASRYMQLVPDRVVRVAVFVVLIAAGASLIIDSLVAFGFFHP